MKKTLVILCCLLILTGCNNKSDEKSSKEKITSEMEYISTQIADLLHNLSNLSLENYEIISENVKISESSGSQGGGSQASSGKSNSSSQSGQGSSGEQSGQGSSNENSKDESISVTEMKNNSVLNLKTDEIDWDSIKKNIEEVNTSWTIIRIDLKNNSVSEEEINSFSNTLNTTIISIKNENKEETLTNLTTLYSYIPKFLTSISADKNIQNIETTKYNIILAYSEALLEKWESVSSHLTNVESNFLSILNNTEYYEKNKFKVNKTHTLIKDLQNSTTNKDKELFLLKYKNLVESLNTF